MRTLALMMAGGQGTRLYPLTRDRAKPAVPFGGKYRIVDFVLSNMVNSEIYSIYLLVQWRSQSLIEHLKDGWQFAAFSHDHFIAPVPAQMRLGESWYQGTADAIFQNLNLIDDNQARSGRRLRRRSYLPDGYPADDRVSSGTQSGGDSGDAAGAVEEGDQFGILDVDSGLRIFRFDEKPKNPRSMPGAPGMCLASMGNYLFDPQVLTQRAHRGLARTAAAITISATTSFPA